MPDDLTAMITTAEQRGKCSLRDEPRARAARGTGRVHVELTNGCGFAFPARRAQGLERASDAEVAQVEILGTHFAGTCVIDRDARLLAQAALREVRARIVAHAAVRRASLIVTSPAFFSRPAPILISI